MKPQGSEKKRHHSILHLGRGLSSHRTQKMCIKLCMSFEKEPGLCFLLLNFCFLTSFPLFLHPLTFLMIICLITETCLNRASIVPSSVQLLSRVRLFVTLWTAARQASLSITNSRSLPKSMSIKSMMSSNHLILWSPSPPVLNLSQHQGLFQWVSSSHQVATVMEFQLQH